MEKVAFIFPGQGSQYVGMGKEFHDHFRLAREIFEEAEDTLHLSLSELCFEGPEEALKQTENTQPAVLTVSIAALKVLQGEKGIHPQITAGHSLGEYSALVASEALTFRDAVQTVRLRGKFMQEAVPIGEGAMAAVLGMTPQEIDTICQKVSMGEVLCPANFNCPGQIVIAGHTKAVQRAIEEVKKMGKKALMLPVSAPFHSPLMKPAGDRLGKTLEGVLIDNLKVPLITNVEAEINTSKERVKPLLVNQVSSPVRWEESMQRMIREGIEQVLEIGPGKVLSGLMKRIGPNLETKHLEDLQTLKRIS